MGYNSLLRSPKKEEQQVPDSSTVTEFNEEEAKEISYNNGEDDQIDIMEELEGILGFDEHEEKLQGGNRVHGHLSWDFMDWESGFGNAEEEEEEEDEFELEYERDQHQVVYTTEGSKLGGFEEEEEEEESGEVLYHHHDKVVKKENLGFWELDNDERKVALNLNLNYQDVLDAWSDRGPLWADECSMSMASNGYYMGEVPVMEEERTRREASVLRYKEKRQNRLFSKKIRYQVRKLNADKRPRLKGRFVKRVS